MRDEILMGLKDLYSGLFTDERHFTYLYGTQAYGIEGNTSDLDLVTVVKYINPAKLNMLVACIIDMHKKYSLEIDNEVPYDRKLITTFDMMSRAVEGRGFHYEDGVVIIPELKKTKKYLLSDELMHRLLLNTITGKSLLISGDEHLFNKYRDEGWDTMLKVMFNIHNQSLTVPGFVDKMICSNNREGESYMGYKDKSLVRVYLNGEVARRLGGYHKKGLLMKRKNDDYMPRDESFMILPKWRKQ